MEPPAPGRLSATNGWPSCCCSFSATTRAAMSVACPGGHGTTTLTGRFGYPWAPAAAAIFNVTTASAVRNIDPPLAGTPMLAHAIGDGYPIAAAVPSPGADAVCVPVPASRHRINGHEGRVGEVREYRDSDEDFEQGSELFH